MHLKSFFFELGQLQLILYFFCPFFKKTAGWWVGKKNLKRKIFNHENVLMDNFYGYRVLGLVGFENS